jgi:hypothetical protein
MCHGRWCWCSCRAQKPRDPRLRGPSGAILPVVVAMAHGRPEQCRETHEGKTRSESPSPRGATWSKGRKSSSWRKSVFSQSLPRSLRFWLFEYYPSGWGFGDHANAEADLHWPVGRFKAIVKDLSLKLPLMTSPRPTATWPQICEKRPCLPSLPNQEFTKYLANTHTRVSVLQTLGTTVATI